MAQELAAHGSLFLVHHVFCLFPIPFQQFVEVDIGRIRRSPEFAIRENGCYNKHQ